MIALIDQKKHCFTVFSSIGNRQVNTYVYHMIARTDQIVLQCQVYPYHTCYSNKYFHQNQSILNGKYFSNAQNKNKKILFTNQETIKGINMKRIQCDYRKKHKTLTLYKQIYLSSYGTRPELGIISVIYIYLSLTGYYILYQILYIISYTFCFQLDLISKHLTL